ncbi:MAG: aldehyde dehydrogenase family protein [Gemmataceae bacterium]|nr:aldehyde dehydrogenase family protein [Gemmataceae bacterium]
MPTLNDTLASLGVPSLSAVAIGRRWIAGSGALLDIHSPIDGSRLASIPQATAADLKPILEAATAAFTTWRLVPAPVRGEFVRRIGTKLREKKDLLAEVVTAEAGKIVSEARGEVQEMIDICDFAVGLSRQLHGLTIASERPGHRLMEQWHPLGPVGVITAFNFPVAVWAWNAMLGLVCGDPIVWKPSPKTPLCALATHAIVREVLNEMPEVPDGVACLIVGGTDVGEAIAAAPELPLVSATGSTRMGRAVGVAVAQRFGKSLLELGGNNAMIVAPSADLELAVRAITFAAVGTCGQRCTTLRRLIVHESIAASLVERLKAVYAKLPIGDPREPGTLVGPLIDGAAFDAMQTALASARKSGGKVFGGERVSRAGHYVCPAIVTIDANAPIVQHETFAPILYVMTYRELNDAIAIQNGVPQGLSSAILTNDLREAEMFLSPAGSDCGIANVNIGTSGAEIGGAFGGEKETGGGRESGSDSWKTYMRRATNTINYSNALPLAQGVRFDV